LGDAIERMDDGRVVATAERLADLDELESEDLAREVHRDLPRDGEVLRARLRLQPVDGDAPFARDALLDLAHAILPLRAVRSGTERTQLVPQCLTGELDGDDAMLQRGEREKLDDRPFELADVRLDVVRDEVQDVVRDRVLEMIHLGLAAK